MIHIEKSKRWPLFIFLVLGTTICVNVFFAWLAVSDYGGGFELVVSEDDDSSYKRKVSLEKNN
jgi:nitrogen fixation protein FixH